MITEGFDNLEEVERVDKEDIYSKIVRAGKRTYFFDVKATRRNDFYLTITESKKRIGREGKFFFEKHKIFLYKEDFEKFADGLNDVVEYIRSQQGDFTDTHELVEEEVGAIHNEYTSIEFDDLEK
ncbi:MAG: PUR family DNA/RNA-binding protein [Bacteroidales bacterium]|nr:PUR family DNA/RNA-binding protein [Bacteroidales bacterium]